MDLVNFRNIAILAFVYVVYKMCMDNSSVVHKMSNLDDPREYKVSLADDQTSDERKKLMEMQRQNEFGCQAADMANDMSLMNGGNGGNGMNGGIPSAMNADFEVGATLNGNSNGNGAALNVGNGGNSSGYNNGGNGMNGMNGMNGNGNGNGMNGNGNGNGVDPLMQGNSIGLPGYNPEFDDNLDVSGKYNNASNFPVSPNNQLSAEELLPQETGTMFSELNPNGEGPLDRSFLTPTFHIGIDTVGQSLRNANLQIRSEPPNPQVVVSPWNNSTIAPDLIRKPLEDCGDY